MLKNKEVASGTVFVRIVFSLVLAATLFLLYYAVFTYIAPLRQQAELNPCHAEKNSTLQIECIFRVITKELHAHGVSAAMETFSTAYRTFPSFVQTACHPQAHRVGDIVYFQIYEGLQDLDSMEFPESLTACGYGFFHGFFEHLVQNNANASFIEKNCTYFTNRLGKTMGDIQRICYHGSGHGLANAEAEHLTKSDWGNVKIYTTKAVEVCDSLHNVRALDIEECKEGVFNVLSTWMQTKQYGFTFEKNKIFSNCLQAPPSGIPACYAEMAQNSGVAANFDPIVLSALVTEITDPEIQKKAFGIGIMGIVQEFISRGSDYRNILISCEPLDQKLFAICAQSVIGGLFEHGQPGEEYKKPLALCTESSLVGRGLEENCYGRVATMLVRFYAPTRIKDICAEFPAAYSNLCREKTTNTQ